MARKSKRGRHPRIGERRRSRQPFTIEKLPIAWQDWIKQQRAIPNVTPWEQIEERSATALAWKELPPETLRLFPRRRLPALNMWRWYDVACVQVQRENEAQRQSSVAVANSLLGGGYKNLPESVRTALADQVFQINRAVREGDQDQFQARLIDLGLLLVKFERNRIAQQKVEVARQQLELQNRIAAKVKGLRESVAKKKLTPQELDRGLEELYGLTQQK